MTLEETIRSYIYTAVDNYLEEHLEHILRQRNNNQSYVSEYITEELISSKRMIKDVHSRWNK